MQQEPRRGAVLGVFAIDDIGHGKDKWATLSSSSEELTGLGDGFVTGVKK